MYLLFTPHNTSPLFPGQQEIFDIFCEYKTFYLQSTKLMVQYPPGAAKAPREEKEGEITPRKIAL
jgi:hypothetical protein